jgi:hypothetical protein
VRCVRAGLFENKVNRVTSGNSTKSSKERG